MGVGVEDGFDNAGGLARGMIARLGNEGEDEDRALVGVVAYILGPLFLDSEALNRVHVEVGGTLGGVALDLDEAAALLGAEPFESDGEIGKVGEVDASGQDGAVEGRVGMGAQMEEVMSLIVMVGKSDAGTWWRVTVREERSTERTCRSPWKRATTAA